MASEHTGLAAEVCVEEGGIEMANAIPTVFRNADYPAEKARGERPQYFADPAIDKTLAITLALAGEVAVLRDRIDSIERLAEAGQAPTRAAVDAFLPDAAVRAARDAWRDSYLDTVLRIIHQEREELEQRAADTQPYAAVIDEVEKTG